jgi:hypothetical protein
MQSGIGMGLDPVPRPRHLVLERPIRDRPGAIAGVREHVLTLRSHHQSVQDFLGFALDREFAFARPPL